jgi:TolB-like protein
MMKKLCLLAILFLIAGVFAFSQEKLSLDKAILTSADKIEREINARKKIALLNFISSSQGLSSYVIDELMDIFTNHKKLEVTERSRMDAILRERNYQTSGEVSDAEIRAIGNQLGADYIITGQLDYSGITYRFRIYAIDIEKGTRIASTTANINNNDKQLKYFLGGEDEDGGMVQSYERQKKTVEFSIGLGGYAQYIFENFNLSYGGENKYYEATYMNLGGYLSLSADFFSYFLLDMTLFIGYSMYSEPEDNYDGSYILERFGNYKDNRITLSLLGKVPLQITQSLYFFPLAGIVGDSGWNISLRAGAGLNYDFNKRLRFDLKILYDFILVGQAWNLGTDSLNYSAHGPGILIGLRYVF